MDIKALFPTLVGVVQAPPETVEAIQLEVMQQKALLESLLKHSWGDNVLSTFESEKNIFVAAKLDQLKTFVESSILQFIGMTRKDHTLELQHSYTQSWVNITKKFGFQERHNHDRGVEGVPISGVYYFNTNQNDGSLGLFPSDLQAKFFGNYDIDPEVGKLVLFRSEVFHRVSANLTDSDRISFSFNYLLAQ